MGPHAGEDFDGIFMRKVLDIWSVGKTFWLVRSRKAKPDIIQAVCSAVHDQAGQPLCAFIEPSIPGGTVSTKRATAASEYSTDLLDWKPLPFDIGPVTGQITRNACALVFDRLTMPGSESLDLWQYAEFLDQTQPVKFQKGVSAIGVVTRDTSAHPDRMKSHIRRVVAVGRLVEPFAVWLR